MKQKNNKEKLIKPREHLDYHQVAKYTYGSFIRYGRNKNAE
jgi:hypothetical protein